MEPVQYLEPVLYLDLHRILLLMLMLLLSLSLSVSLLLLLLCAEGGV
jgi:hypothetical protein